MLFSNPDILKSSLDVRIGGIKVSDTPHLSYLDFMARVKSRILTLCVKYVKASLAEGVTYPDAIGDLASLVYAQLNIDELIIAEKEEDIVFLIMKSAQFANWEAEIHDRYLEIHKGVVTNTTPMPIDGKFHEGINKEVIEEIEKEDSFSIFLDGLASASV